MKRFNDILLNEFVTTPFEGLSDTTLQTDVLRIGSARAILLLDQDVTVTEAVVVPATLQIKFLFGAKIIVNGGSVTFSGNPFVDRQEMSREALFQAAGAEIQFNGPVPVDISSEIAYSATDSLTLRLALLTNWFSGSQTTFHCFARPITSAVVMNDHHSLYFRTGDFHNTYPNGTNVPAFTLGSYTTFSSEKGAFIRESNAGVSPQMVATKVGCSDTVIEDNYFLANGGGGDGASANVIISGSSWNCHIRNNVFDGIAGYHAGIVMTAGQQPPQNCSITDNTFLGFLTQLAFVTSGRNIQVSRNKFLLANVTGYSGFSLIDIEPNFKDEVIEDLDICDNYIDIRNVTQIGTGIPLYNTAIIIQGVVTVGAKRVRVNGNRILATPSITQTAIKANGVTGLEIADNRIDASGIPWNLTQCDDVYIHNNVSHDKTDGSCYVVGIQNAKVWDNLLRYPGSLLIEGEVAHNVGGNGVSTIQLQHSYSDSSDGRIYESYIGGTVTFQDTNYTVQSVVTNKVFQEIVVSGTVDNVGCRNFDPSSVNPTANTFTVPGHGWVTGQPLIIQSWSAVPSGIISGFVFAIVVDANTVKLATTAANATGGIAIDITDQGVEMQQIMPRFLTTDVNVATDTIHFPNHKLADKSIVRYYGDTPIGGLVNQPYFVIRVDADNVKLATTRANAVSGTAINLTDQGAGLTQILVPVLITVFSNNKYRNNNFSSYTLNGTSTNNGGF